MNYYACLAFKLILRMATQKAEEGEAEDDDDDEEKPKKKAPARKHRAKVRRCLSSIHLK